MLFAGRALEAVCAVDQKDEEAVVQREQQRGGLVVGHRAEVSRRLRPSDSEAARERLPTAVVVPGGRHAVSGGGGGGSGTERFGRDAVVGEG